VVGRKPILLRSALSKTVFLLEAGSAKRGATPLSINKNSLSLEGEGRVRVKKLRR